MPKQLRVVHVSPTYLSPDSFVGGGERFVEELALAMSAVAATKLVAFGSRPNRQSLGAHGERVILRNWTRSKMTPFSPWLWEELRGADVVHCHQYYTLSTFLAAWYGRLQGSKVFVTDLGGGAWTPGYQIDVSRWIEGHLPLSRYAARALPGVNKQFRIIGAGVDHRMFTPRLTERHDGSVVFLGRVLPHKGVHFLIEGLPADLTLHVIGPAPDPSYLAALQDAARNKHVQFHHRVDDAGVVRYLRSAMALVHPTPVDDTGDARGHELFGLAVVEAMACGCPVIASRAASLPEIVEDGSSGFLVPPNDSSAIASRLARLFADGELWARMSRAAERRAQEFSWERVSARCREAYGDAS